MSWRTNPALVITIPRLLAEKFREVGWKALSKQEREFAVARLREVMEHLSEQQRVELAELLLVPLPAALPPATPQRPIGKQALIAKLKAQRRAQQNAD